MKKLRNSFVKKAIVLVSLSVAIMGSTTSFASYVVDDTSNVYYDLSLSEQALVEKYVEVFPDLEYEIIDTVRIISQMPSYISAYEQDESMAYELLKSGLNNLVSHTSLSTDGADYKGLFYANYTVPVVKQSTAYNCGIAAALQAIIGDGFLSNTTSNKSASKMTTLAGYVDYDENSVGAQAWQVRDVINYYKSDTYSAVPITIYTIDYIFNDMESSFINGYCPVITLTDTSELSYYNDSYNHWVTVSQINDNNKTITLVDPFNSSVCGGESSYGGTHTVSYDEFIDAIGVGGDCWLVLDTMYPDWAA